MSPEPPEPTTTDWDHKYYLSPRRIQLSDLKVRPVVLKGSGMGFKKETCRDT